MCLYTYAEKHGVLFIIQYFRIIARAKIILLRHQCLKFGRIDMYIKSKMIADKFEWSLLEQCQTGR